MRTFILMVLGILVTGQMAVAEQSKRLLLMAQPRAITLYPRPLFMPKVTIDVDGVVMGGFVNRRGQGEMKVLEKLSQKELRRIEQEIQASKHGKIQRWESGKICLVRPKYKIDYLAVNPQVYRKFILRTGDDCLGGGLENTSKSAKALTAVLMEYVQSLSK